MDIKRALRIPFDAQSGTAAFDHDRRFIEQLFEPDVIPKRPAELGTVRVEITVAQHDFARHARCRLETIVNVVQQVPRESAPAERLAITPHDAAVRCAVLRCAHENHRLAFGARQRLGPFAVEPGCAGQGRQALDARPFALTRDAIRRRIRSRGLRRRTGPGPAGFQRLPDRRQDRFDFLG